MDIITIQWLLVLGLGIFFVLFSPYARSEKEFFKASSANDNPPGILMLTGSLVISWIMAKSITNSANLGLRFGIAGGFAYALYYLSFAIAGYLIYKLRTQGGYKSIHHFLESKFGKSAMLVFTLLITIRLFNDVWSNTIVIGTYYGDKGSQNYYLALIIFTVLTLAYTLKGGLKTSIFTDFVQMILFAILLVVICNLLFNNDKVPTSAYLNTDGFSFAMAANLIFAVLIQCFSYPFHDPVLTDRAFITKPRVMLRSYGLGTLIGFVCILLFSLIGVYGRELGLEGQAAVEVGKTFGPVMMLIINLIMITSAASTLDSTFSSFSKLVAVDLKLGYKISVGRLTMIALAILGTIPVFLNPEILDASTISGTMVIGLTPIFLFWKVKVPKISFYATILCGILCGMALIFDFYPRQILLTDGPYADLLWVNFWGVLLCLTVYFIPKFIWKEKQKIWV